MDLQKYLTKYGTIKVKIWGKRDPWVVLVLKNSATGNLLHWG